MVQKWPCRNTKSTTELIFLVKKDRKNEGPLDDLGCSGKNSVKDVASNWMLSIVNQSCCLQSDLHTIKCWLNFKGDPATS